MGLTLLLGGARSGKTSLAVQMAERHTGPVAYVATAPITDDDMAARIERHRGERPPHWTTIEEQTDLAAAIASAVGSMVVIDCLTLWTSNLMWAERSDDDIEQTAIEVATTCAQLADPVVAITNEVGMGVHPETELGRRYRDVLGRVNQMWASRADTALLMVAGRAIRLTDPHEHVT